MKVTPTKKNFKNYQPGDVFELPDRTARLLIKAKILASVDEDKQEESTPDVMAPEQGDKAAPEPDAGEEPPAGPSQEVIEDPPADTPDAAPEGEAMKTTDQAAKTVAKKATKKAAKKVANRPAYQTRDLQAGK